MKPANVLPFIVRMRNNFHFQCHSRSPMGLLCLAHKSNLRFLMVRAGFVFLNLSIVLSSTTSHAQALRPLHQISLKNEPAAVSIDQNAHIYIANKNGSVLKYDRTGNLLFVYSPQRPGNIKSIEAWSTLNVLLFYEDLQEYRFLDRFLTLTSTSPFSPDIFVRLVTGSADNNLWVFDDKDYTLKKINLNYNTPEIVSSLTNIVEDNFQGNCLKEYQHLIFLSDIHAGIYVFDNLGNYIKTLPLPDVHYFNFIKNELYFLSNGAIHFFNLYTGDKRKISIPSAENYLFALVSERYLFLISKESLDIYDL